MIIERTEAGPVEERTVSPLASVITFVVLVCLTVATVSVSFIPMGPAAHLAVALAFAFVKSALVALFFMHLIRGQGRTWVAAGVGLSWLAILLFLTMCDYMARPHATF